MDNPLILNVHTPWISFSLLFLEMFSEKLSLAKYCNCVLIIIVYIIDKFSGSDITQTHFQT